MSTAAPLPFEWTGEEFRPLPRFRKICDAAFTIGERYFLVEEKQRSAITHNHFFATLHDGWLNLPDEYADRFPTEEHLRKHALIRCGFADSRQFVASSKAEAVRLMAFVKPLDEYAVILISECVVTVWTARSQSRRAMGAKDFQLSKQAVLDYVASLIGTETRELEANAKSAA